MDVNFLQLIVDFQNRVQEALKLMQRSGITMPNSSSEWIESDIPLVGNLDGGIKYYKHGAGCLVMLEAGEVDFDFGPQGEIGGFNLWWLTRFVETGISAYSLKNKTEIAQHLKDSIDRGELICPDGDLYYIANAPYLYAIDIDSRNLQDSLPSRNQDRVLALYIHYFETADFMFKNYDKLSKKLYKSGKLNQYDKSDMRIYLSTWLGFLGVVCEGVKKLKIRILLGNERPESFKELIPASDAIGKLMKEHSDSLRMFRNNVFHLRENTEFVRHFFDDKVERLVWARELHMALSGFFSEYRVCCEVHYVKNGRKGESDLINKGRLLREKK